MIDTKLEEARSWDSAETSSGDRAGKGLRSKVLRLRFDRTETEPCNVDLLTNPVTAKCVSEALLSHVVSSIYIEAKKDVNQKRS